MIELPWPDKALSPNARSGNHWARTRATKKARSDAFYATRAAKLGIVAGGAPVRMKITFHPPDSRKRDDDGMIASLKAARDGIADALGVDDNLFRPTYVYADPVKGGMVTVAVLP